LFVRLLKNEQPGEALKNRQIRKCQLINPNCSTVLMLNST
jgi:hypothetical protein